MNDKRPLTVSWCDALCHSAVTYVPSPVRQSAAVTTDARQTTTSCVHATTAVLSRTTRNSSADFTSPLSTPKSVLRRRRCLLSLIPFG